MKIRERALAILLSMVMMLTFMPALAFAEGEEADADGTPVAEEAVVPEEAVETPDMDSEAVVDADQDINEVTEENTAMTTQSTEWDLEEHEVEILYTGSPVTLEPKVTGDVPAQLSYQWYKGEYDEYFDVEYTEISGATGKAYSGVTADSYYDNYYKVVVTDEDGDSNECEFNVYVDAITQGVVTYTANDAQTCDATISEKATGEVSVLASVAFADGKTRKVTYLFDDYSNSTAVHVPATVSEMWAVGWSDYVYDENKDTYTPIVKPGFVIFGTNGTYAQTYANKYGITFRDLAAEAEAARQGTPDGSLPKVKIAKPKAAKKSATVKWKKLNKKQLKKSKAQKIEIWVCPNGGFGPNDTIMKTAGKKKASLKVKGLKKGTYFVKVRAIKYVGGVKKVGPWSKVKKVKIKK